METCKKRRTIFEKLPFEIVDNKEDARVQIVPGKTVLVGPKKYEEPETYKTYGLDIYNFEARPDDIYLIGYIRSGTTLHCEMVWQIGNDLNYEEGSKNFVDYRFPHIDFSLMGITKPLAELLKKDDVNKEAKEVALKYQELDLMGLSKRKGRRFIKSHLPLSLMPPHIFEAGAKVIYCARNPRDVLVSTYRIGEFFTTVEISNFKDIFESFINDSVWNGPYFEHVKEAWQRRNDENFLFLFYEDTIKDKRRTIQKVADFLGKELTKEQIDGLEDYLSFEKFKNNKSVNCDQLIKAGFAKADGQFIRKGKVGGWKELFDKEMERRFDQWMEKNLKGTDLRFPEI